MFIVTIYAAQQLPIESSARQQQLALLLFGIGLGWTALSGYRSVQRGWRLRLPTVSHVRLLAIDLVGDLLVGGLMLVIVARSSQSRLLTAGLDRLATAMALVALVSLAMSLLTWRALRHDNAPPAEAAELTIPWVRFVMAMLVIAVAAAMELSAM